MYQLRNPDLLKDLFLLIGDRTGHITTYMENSGKGLKISSKISRIKVLL